MKYLLYVALFVCFTACATDDADQRANENDSSNFHDPHDETGPRKADSIRLADSIKIADSISAATAIVDSTFSATFRFFYTRAYCGGARPSDEIINSLNTPKLLTNSTLMLVNHFTGTQYKCVLGSDGKSAVQMTEGKYDIFLTSEVNTETGFDPKCSLWTKQLLQTIKVTDNGKMQDITIHFVCNPCDEKMKMRP